MKTVIFSDTHLTHHDDPAKRAFLLSLLRQADRIVINGDFWDGFHTTWERFQHSTWRELFALLRKKQTVYLFGNHDPAHLAKDPALFAQRWGQAYLLSKRQGLYVTHGHHFNPGLVLQISPTTKLLSTLIPYQRVSFSRIYAARAHRLVRSQAILHGYPHIITGHTHLPWLDTQYSNSGYIHHGHASWLTYEDGQVALHQTTYR